MLNILKVAHMYSVKIFISLLLHARYWIYIVVKSMWSLLSFSLPSFYPSFIPHICMDHLLSIYFVYLLPINVPVPIVGT